MLYIRGREGSQGLEGGQHWEEGVILVNTEQANEAQNTGKTNKHGKCKGQGKWKGQGNNKGKCQSNSQGKVNRVCTADW